MCTGSARVVCSGRRYAEAHKGGRGSTRGRWPKIHRLGACCVWSSHACGHVSALVGLRLQRFGGLFRGGRLFRLLSQSQASPGQCALEMGADRTRPVLLVLRSGAAHLRRGLSTKAAAIRCPLSHTLLLSLRHLASARGFVDRPASQDSSSRLARCVTGFDRHIPGPPAGLLEHDRSETQPCHLRNAPELCLQCGNFHTGAWRDSESDGETTR